MKLSTLVCSRFLASVLLAAPTLAMQSPSKELGSAVRGAVPKSLELPSLFSDHMVLQAARKVPVWGWAKPGQRVVVKIAGQEREAKADAQGRWRVTLAPIAAKGPFEMSVEADRRIRVRDVLVGEVWLGSGQSNMNWSVRRSKDFETERDAARFPKLRMFTVTRNASPRPRARCKGKWLVCTPQTVAGFSATAYFFARRLHKALDRPLGIVHSSWGGTAVEAWTSMPVQRTKPELAGLLKAWDDRVARWDEAAAKKRHATRLKSWQRRAARARKEGKRPRRKPRMEVSPVANQNRPANLFNGMIEPLIPYAMRGVIWYQGERNARTVPSAELYALQLPLMIEDWRARWGQGDFPFLFVQLPNFKKRVEGPGQKSAWASIRESMRRTLRVPNTGMAITLDVGEAKDIHPKDKQSVGARLARWALATVYGKNIVPSGPLFESWSLDGSRAVVTFRHSGGRLIVRGHADHACPGFELLGKDGRWRSVIAKIDGARAILEHDAVKEPQGVRYAWADNPKAWLVGKGGLPASPFEAKKPKKP